MGGQSNFDNTMYDSTTTNYNDGFGYATTSLGQSAILIEHSP